MEIPIYYFGRKKGDKLYVVCLSRAHARIRPVEDVLDGKRTLITYTSLGAAKKALANRNIYSYYASGSEYGWKEDPYLAKKDMRLMTGKLTLDK
jgi:hypothetical protein